MGKKSRTKRERREGFPLTLTKAPRHLSESIAFVLPAITDIDDLDNAVAFPTFEMAALAADEMGFDEIAEVNCLGSFVLGPTASMWTRLGDGWAEVPPTLCEHHA